MGWTDESRERCRALVTELGDILAAGLESQPPAPQAWEGSAQAEAQEWLLREKEEEACTSYEEEQRLTQLSMEAYAYTDQ